MQIQESGEMYLETIHVLLKKNGHVRSVDISEHMGYSKPSVSRAMGLLRNGGYIQVDKDGFIGIFTGGLTASAGGIAAAITAGLLASLIFKAKDKS